MASPRSQPRELDWPSTQGWTVYNLLSFSGRDMTRAELLQAIHEYHDQLCDAAYMEGGIAFLLQRRMVKLQGDKVVLPGRDPRTRKGPPLVRARNDAELVRALPGACI